MYNMRKRVNSVNMAMEILNCYDPEKMLLGITELSKKLGVSKSTIHRLVTTMEKQGYLEQDPVSRKYKLGLSILRLSEIIMKNYDIRTIAAPIMQKLRDYTEESVHLNVVSYARRARVCIEKYESQHDLRYVIELGQYLPLHLGASGKILLANLDEHYILDILESFSDSEKQRILSDLELIRSQGYCISYGERIPGASSISYAIKNRSGKLIAGLTVSGPSMRLTEDKLEEYLELVKNAGADISRQAGYQS